MNRFKLMIFVLMLTCIGTAAEENPVGALDSAKYHVTDVLNPQNNRIELWNLFDLLVTEDNSYRYRIIKRAFNSRNTEIETHTEWFTENRSSGDEHYLRLRFTIHPNDLEPGQASFGHVEELASDTQLQNWPMFYRLEIKKRMYHASFSVFIPNGHMWHIVKEYEDGMYHFPRREENIIKLGEEIVDHIIHERIDN